MDLSSFVSNSSHTFKVNATINAFDFNTFEHICVISCYGMNLIWREFGCCSRNRIFASSMYIISYRHAIWTISKTPVSIILWCPTTKMLIKACYLIQPLEQEGGCQKCCIALCSKVFINHFYQMKASSECFNILIYWSKYWVDRRTIRRKV